jgi:hypothetical protein
MKPPAPQQTRLKHAKEIKEEESEGEPKATTPQKKKGIECYIPKKFRLTLLQHR